MLLSKGRKFKDFELYIGALSHFLHGGSLSPGQRPGFSLELDSQQSCQPSRNSSILILLIVGGENA